MAAKQNEASFDRIPLAGKIGILVAVVAVIIGIYYFALHMSVVEEIDSARRRRVQLTGEMREAQERNAEYVRLREQMTAREQLDRANLTALPELAEMPQFLTELNREAELSGLSILLVEPRPEEPEERYVRLPVRLRIGGSYHQLARFFYNASRLNRLVSMDDIELDLRNPDNTDGESVELTVDVEATTYRRPSDAELEGVAAGGAG